MSKSLIHGIIFTHFRHVLFSENHHGRCSPSDLLKHAHDICPLPMPTNIQLANNYQEQHTCFITYSATFPARGHFYQGIKIIISGYCVKITDTLFAFLEPGSKFSFCICYRSTRICRYYRTVAPPGRLKCNNNTNHTLQCLLLKGSDTNNCFPNV